MPKIYALLVGITDYPGNELYQCVEDAKRMKQYVSSLDTSNVDSEIKVLANQQASKEKIVNAFKDHLGQATDEDVVLFYFSGHGAQQRTKGIFHDESDQALDCLVCYSGKETDTRHDQFLSGKEIRYLLYKMPHNPHIVTIIDACHSGDIVRSVEGGPGQRPVIRKISGYFDERPYADFIFAGDADVEKQENGQTTVFIPFKNYVHLAACLSSESALEDLNGGIFTSYLLNLLESAENRLTYLDITRWANISLQKVTSYKQTPRLSVQGKGNINQYSPWLNLFDENVQMKPGKLENTRDGVLYMRGSLLGMKPGMQVRVHLNDSESELVEVESVDLKTSKLKMPLSLINRMDFKKNEYTAETESTTYAELNLYINEIRDTGNHLPEVTSIVEATDNVKITPDGEASFYLNLFNGYAYFSLPDTPYRPLARQLQLGTMEIEQGLKRQLEAIVKWNHFKTLENPGDTFAKCPVRVEIQREGEAWEDVSNGLIRMEANPERLDNGEFYQVYKVKLTNLSSENLFVGVLTLNSNMGISSMPFDQRVLELSPNGKAGDSRLFYDHYEEPLAATTFDRYKEVYNWKEEWLYYKFIFNNFEDFTGSIASGDFLQPALEPPLLELGLMRGDQRSKGEGAFQKVKKVKKKWGTCITRLELANPTYNKPSGQLTSNFQAYAKSDAIRPFLDKIYPESLFND